jgi:MoaA/NifB/PqqE/SkfB family radical SAM enzyme
MMVNELIKITAHPQSGFYLYEYEQLNDILQKLENKKQQVLLIGVTFALLDFAEKYPQQLKSTVVMETGGMKGRRKEITREEAHHYLRNRLGVNVIHSEYGMTELLSQAYSKDQGLFECVPWMKVLLRNEDDPFDVTEVGRGIINIIDFANVYSCSFIATDDVGTVHKDGKFEVAGRLDNSDMRGCSLLVI